MNRKKDAGERAGRAAASDAAHPGRGTVSVAAVILAAGRSTRMGNAHKLLLPYGDVTVIGAVARTAEKAGLYPVVTVVGHEAPAVCEALVGRRVEVVTNPAYAQGQGSSLAAGIAAVRRRPEVGAAAVLLADEPGVPLEAIRAVVAVWREGGPPAVRVRYRDRPGHPVLFDRSLFSRLTALRGEGGLRAASGGLEGPGLSDMSVGEVGLDLYAPVDIDTPADHAAALARLRR
ncbi:MAG: NTP transferase domain-containing protein [Gemmatimonadota bacterium]